MSSPGNSTGPRGSTSRSIARLRWPLREFLETEVAGGVAILVATGAALLWANSPFRESYDSVWEIPISLQIGSASLDADLRHWINEGLMAIFFFVVGLEIKRELVRGELSDKRTAMLPVLGALGGMAVPAAIYLLVNAGDVGERGWAIAMPTDIAFALGVLSLFGRSLDPSGRLFLLSLAIVDDIGTVAIMVLFYSVEIELASLLVAFVLLGVMFVARLAGIRWNPLFILLSVGVWLATFESNINATLAGVAVAFVTPVRPLDSSAWVRLPRIVQRFGHDPSPELLRETRQHAHAGVSKGEWLEHVLHPWASFAIIPLFALANTGLYLGGGVIGDVVGSSISIGIVAGRVIGKPLGILALVWLATKLRLASMPEGLRWEQMAAVAVPAGVGFTVALVVADLALYGRLERAAVFGLLAATGISALASWVVLRSTTNASAPSRK
jgi:Na+/H+ antiporter NhaA